MSYSKYYNLNNVNIEPFALLSFGDDDSQTTNQNLKDAINANKNVNDDKVRNAISNLSKTALNKAVTENKLDLQCLIQSEIELSITNVKATGNVVIKNNDLHSSVKLECNMQSTSNISKKISDSFVDEFQKQLTKEDKDYKLKDTDGTQLGTVTDQVSNVASDAINTYGDIANGMTTSIGKAFGDAVTGLTGKTGGLFSAGTNNSIAKYLNHDLEENKNFNGNTKTNYSTTMNGAQSFANFCEESNIKKIIGEHKAAIQAKVSDIDAGGDVEISGLKLENAFDVVLKAMVDDTVNNDIGNQIYKNLQDVVQQLFDAQDTDKSRGDIAAAGVAVAQTLEKTGDAAGKVLDSAGGAVKDVGEGVGTAAKGVGEGVSTIFTSLRFLFLAIIVIGLVYLIFKARDPAPAADTSATSDDDLMKLLEAQAIAKQIKAKAGN